MIMDFCWKFADASYGDVQFMTFIAQPIKRVFVDISFAIPQTTLHSYFFHITIR